MSNKDKAINQKIALEINKQVWILKTKEGNIIDKFRQKQVAIKEKRRKEKLYLDTELILERDNSYREQLKEGLKNAKKRKV